MITRETDYAIRALLRLALANGGIVSTSVLATEMDIPYRFLRRIVLKLGAQGLVRSLRGKQGGLQLARPAEKISLLDVVKAVDAEAILLNTCLSDHNDCPREAFCVVHEELSDIQDELHRRFAQITLAGLASRDRARVCV